MLVSDHCSAHPSREARLRCRSCRCWVCDRCALKSHDGIFCSTRCRIKHHFSRLGSGFRNLVTRPLDLPWAIAVISAAAALLMSGIGVLIGELREVTEPTSFLSNELQRPQVHLAKIRANGDTWALEIEGEAEARVVLTQDNGMSKVVTLDDDGKGRVELSSPDASMLRVEVSALREEPDLVAERVVVAKPTPIPTSTPEPTPEPTPSPKLSPTSPAPTRTPVPPRQPAPAPSPTPTSPPQPPPTPQPTIPPIRVATVDEEPGILHREQTPNPKDGAKTTSTPARQETSGPTPPVLHLVIDAGPRIAVTFDGGASSNHTSDLLDLLRELDIRASLFLTGQFIDRQPALVRRALLEGHEIGNHTFSHPHLTTWEQNRRHQTLPGITRESLQQELRRTEASFQKATGRPMVPLWRAPFGEENAALRRWAYEIGYLHVRWSSLEGRSLDTLDWISDEHNALYRDSKRIVNNLLAFPRLEGGIVLMHLATDREVPPWEHLPEFVAALKKRGISQVKVTTLLEGSKIWDGWLHGAAERHAKETRAGQ